MVGRPAESEYLKDLVRQFAGEQSIVVAPGAAEDARRMASLGALNQLGGAGHATAASPAALQAAAVSGLLHQQGMDAHSAGFLQDALGDEPTPKGGRFCGACGTPNGLDNAFCESCGTALRS
jgi:hypothetical protein